MPILHHDQSPLPLPGQPRPVEVLLGVVVVMAVVGVVFAPANATVVVGFCGMIAAQLFNTLRQDVAERRAVADRKQVRSATAEVAVEVADARAEVRANREHVTERLDALGAVTASTHGLVNNAMMVQLALVAELSRWKASQLRAAHDGSAESMKAIVAAESAAVIAEKRLAEHRERQAAVDRLANGGGK